MSIGIAAVIDEAFDALIELTGDRDGVTDLFQ